jgi:hypothetical protein
MNTECCCARRHLSSNMSSIRSHPKLQLMFRLGKFTGFSIPENVKSKNSIVTPWELTVFTLILVSLILMLFCFLREVTTIRLEEITQIVIMFMMYFSVLAKTANLLRRKRHLLELFTLMSDLTTFSPFADYQKPVMDLVCKRIRKTVMLLGSLAAAFMFFGMAAIYAVLLVGEYKLEYQSNATDSSHEQGVKKLLKFGKESDWIEKIAFGMNGVFYFILPLKNVIMDCFMCLCHFFVVQQLNLLNRKFHLFKQRSYKMKTIRKFDNEEKDFDKWMEMFNKIRASV